MELSDLRWLVLVVVATCLLFFVYQASKPGSRFNTALRNSGAGSSYSFAKTQLLWWTILILTCFAIAYGEAGIAKDVLNSTSLVLLGISLGTVAAGQVIDYGDEMNPNIVRHQTTRRQFSFLVDILSDHNGISLHRFQALIFNLAFGIIFVIQFFETFGDTSTLPEFDSTTLGLLGLSSGGYLTMKFGENTEASPPAPAAPATPATTPPTPATPPAPAVPPTPVTPDNPTTPPAS
ncbi:MAG: hypothetical protein AAFY48_03390 [Bacteroidota bacterium]